MKNLKFSVLFSFLLLAVAVELTAQDVYSVKSHEVVISGTSNIHDWTVKVVDLTGSAKKTTEAVNDVNITVDAKTLLSSKGSIMDGKMQEALKTESYPKIYYKSLTCKILSENNGVIKISSTGNLTISGVTKSITVTSTCKPAQNENLEVSGSFYLLMTDFGIEPPTALFGSLETADKVTVSYKIVLQK